MEGNSSLPPKLDGFNNTSTASSVDSGPPANVTLTNVQVAHLAFASINALVSLVGNGLSLAVFIRSRLRGTPSSGYLAALAVADTGSAVTAVFMKTSENYDYFPAAVLCHITLFFNEVFLCLSVWFLVCFTVERYISVCHPLSAPRIFSRLRESRVIPGVVLTAALLYSYNLVPGKRKFFSVVSSAVGCTFPENDILREWHNNFIYVTYALVFIVPLALILVLHLLIARKLHHHASKSHLSTRQQEERRAQSNSITRILFLVSLQFLVCNCPLNTLVLLNFLQVPFPFWLYLATVFLFNLSFSCNFFLYALSGAKFRTSLKKLLQCPCSKTGSSDGDREGNGRERSPAAQPQRQDDGVPAKGKTGESAKEKGDSTGDTTSTSLSSSSVDVRL